MASVSMLLLLLLCCYHSPIGHAGDDRHYKVLSIGSLKTAANCSETKASPPSNGTTVPLHHRHGPCSPVATNNTPTFEEVLHRDQLRVGYIQRKVSGAGKKAAVGTQKQAAATVPTMLGTSLDSLQYVLTVEIGSPPVTRTVLMDTGSDVSWVPCVPCSQCHPRADPLFDPSSSSTYSSFSCSSVACAQLGSGGGCGSSSQQCLYSVTYMDGSATAGTYGSDTLVLSPSVVVGNFMFGCSHAESGFQDQIDGLVGLGGGAPSLVSQTAGTFGSAFSYCLPPTPSTSGFLTLGAAANSGFVTTPMTISPQIPTFYFVLLEGIMVNEKLLDVPTSVFSAGSVMDSGTVVTRLPLTAYTALSLAFRAEMQQYPAAPPVQILDTCFDFTGQSSVAVPAVSLVFSGGVVLNLDVNGIILHGCLAFAANSDDSSVGFIGNVQQRTFEVLYDVGQGVVGFKGAAC